MKKAIAFFGFLLLLIGVHAQTKEETEKWLLEKLNGIKAVRNINSTTRWDNGYRQYSRSEFTPEYFELKDGILTVYYNVKRYSKDSKDKSEKVELLGRHIIKAPVNQIDTVFITVAPQNYQGSDYKDTHTADPWILLSFQSNCVTGKENNIETNKNKYMWLLIDPYAEADIVKRLLKAFNHLKTFYPKPKETF